MTQAIEPKEQADPLDGLPVGGIFAFVYQEAGEAGIRECIDMLEAVDKAFLERAAIELDDLGFPHIASVIRDAAQDAPETTDKPYTNGRGDYRDWFRRRHNRMPTPEETPDGLS